LRDISEGHSVNHVRLGGKHVGQANFLITAQLKIGRSQGGSFRQAIQRAANGARTVIEGIGDLQAVAYDIQEEAGELSIVTAELGNQAFMLLNEIDRLLKELVDPRARKIVVAS